MEENQRVAKELDKYLGPEYIKYKTTGYASEPYIEGWAAVAIANKIFGHDGWSSEIKNLSPPLIEDLGSGKITAQGSATVRVTLATGVFREDIGFGVAENVKGRSRAIKQAQKSAVTDALKRALRQFGRALGGCCYDTYYLGNLKKVSTRTRAPITEDMLIRPDSPPPARPSRLNPSPLHKKPHTAATIPATTHTLPSTVSALNLDDMLSSDS
ncbi:DNA repair and recombination protein RAD52 [Nematocida displodere]|uniref:DNA repair and recombination protein RAD52 n=1 Tax=Nematocida displodere TaxID=1805483 RepID=A0A177ED94_9MICR|nr:DNA repair and recombination protein RAD52 [Nematocida displodere]